MKVHELVNELKMEIDKKSKLLEQRKLIMQSIKKGEDFFLRESSGSPTTARLAQGASNMVSYLKQLQEIDTQIFAIDTMIITRLEANASDFVSTFIIPEKINEAGDVVPKRHAAFVPVYSEDPRFVEIIPEDIWYLKILKQAVGMTNVEIVPKSEYYK